MGTEQNRTDDDDDDDVLSLNVILNSNWIN